MTIPNGEVLAAFFKFKFRLLVSCHKNQMKFLPFAITVGLLTPHNCKALDQGKDNQHLFSVYDISPMMRLLLVLDGTTLATAPAPNLSNVSRNYQGKPTVRGGNVDLELP